MTQIGITGINSAYIDVTENGESKLQAGISQLSSKVVSFAICLAATEAGALGVGLALGAAGIVTLGGVGLAATTIAGAVAGMCIVEFANQIGEQYNQFVDNM